MKTKEPLKPWLVYFGFIVLAVFVHELGHSVAAWVMGYKSVPTFAKEYPLQTVPPHAQQYVSLGAILGNVLFAVVAAGLYFKTAFKYKTVLLASALASPCVYTILFLLKGRGHDATEFQEAQAAMGFSYSGHSVDYLFVFMLIAGLFILGSNIKITYKVLLRFFTGVILTFTFMVLLQNLNNLLFDRMFSSYPQ